MRVVGRLFAPEPRGLVEIHVDDNRISTIRPIGSARDLPGRNHSGNGNGAVEAVGGTDCIITPGLLDLQVNGAFGHDFSDPSDDVSPIGALLPRFGVTAFLGCVVTSSPDAYGPCLDQIDAIASGPQNGARLLGAHIEGPFLSPVRAGTHSPEWLAPPSVEALADWADRLTIRLLTLAPELPGSLDVIRFAVDRDIRVAIGHTDATWDESRAAVDAGATLGTHLFNAMRPLHHREPGAAGFLLNSNVAVSVVADGIHVAPEMLQLISRIKGPDEMVIVSDSLAGLGMPPGRYSLGGVEVFTDGVTGRRVDGTLSGSVTPLSDGLRNLINAGLAPEWAVAAATVNPARVLGLSRVHGSVRIGRPADLVVFDDEWSVSATIIGGRVAYRGRDVSSEKLETLAHRI